MEATLYLPYYDYNDSAFDVTDDYYKGNDYIELMSNEFNKNKDIVYNSMLELQNGRTGAFLSSVRKRHRVKTRWLIPVVIAGFTMRMESQMTLIRL